jgi:hypothetical protein
MIISKNVIAIVVIAKHLLSIFKNYKLIIALNVVIGTALNANNKEKNFVNVFANIA